MGLDKEETESHQRYQYAAPLALHRIAKEIGLLYRRISSPHHFEQGVKPEKQKRNKKAVWVSLSFWIL
jgi:hypothetical protein